MTPPSPPASEPSSKQRPERSSPGGEKACVACGTLISATARLCPTCRTYQKKGAWRNWLPYAGGIVGVLTFFGSGAAYTWTKVDSYLSQFRVGAMLLEASTDSSALFLNTGAVPILVTRLEFSSPGLRSRIEDYAVNRVVEPGAVLRFDITEAVHGSIEAPPGESAWRQEVASFAQMGERSGLLALFVTAGHHKIEEFSDASHAHSLEGSARFEYISLRTQKRMETEPLPCRVFLVRAQPSDNRHAGMPGGPR